FSGPVTILEKDYHLSYPFVFRYQSGYYLVPESYANRSIDLYKCTSFPDKWEYSYTIMDNIAAVDSTLLFYNNKFWLFCNAQENEGVTSLDELYIFYSDDITSTNWRPHAKNPVVSDVKKSRPAGKIFEYEGALYRPAQNSSKHYGRGLHIGKIITLTEEEYVEESVQYIFPNWQKNLSSVHTINHDGKITVIDAQLKKSRF
ncbi:MAG: hypothetical protein ABIO05_00875, partial [Ferruginibacter sp.]